jgi:Domain of unknown function (DUF4159)
MLRFRRRLVLLVLLPVLVVTTVYAQRRFREGSGRFGGHPVRLRPTGLADRSFAFCRLMYQSVRSEPSGIGWSTDYPYADINLMIRLSELTKTPVSMSGEAEPNHWVVRPTDDALFDCPFVMASDIGTVGFLPAEVERLREYLLKGGFLWVDDFWGTLAWQQWEQEIARVLPPAQYPIVDVPPDHAVFRTLFNVSKVPQITNIQFWRTSRGRTTSERGSDSADAHFRVITGEHGRILVAMTHNTDVADSWEREGEDPNFFHQFSPDGYAMGINVLMYALTH